MSLTNEPNIINSMKINTLQVELITNELEKLKWRIHRFYQQGKITRQELIDCIGIDSYEEISKFIREYIRREEN